MISYLIRYNWAFMNGKVKPKDDYEGLAYKDMVAINLDDIEEKVLAVVKEYRMDYLYVLDQMYYPDVTVLYAKMANTSAFKTYNEYLNLDEQGKGKYVSDYGVPEPYTYQLLTPEKQRETIEAEKEPKNSLKDLYRHGGKIDDRSS